MNSVSLPTHTGRSLIDALAAKSGSMRDMLHEVTAFAGSDGNTLIEGETGVGKELVAKILHQKNLRYCGGPFVAVNCGSIPEGLLESLFFGHAKGAFTGAQQSHKGFFEQACGGTLFLDEVGDLPLLQQVKLLRVLQTFTVTPVGSEVSVPLDFRLVTATNRNLRQMVREGTFRSDLFYRLAVIEIRVPNLEQRGAAEKIEIFQTVLQRMLGDDEFARYPTPDWVRSRVATMRFAGNVRQLKNLAERIGVIVHQTGQWGPHISKALEQTELMNGPSAQARRNASDARERQDILSELELNGWHRQKTADQLGMSRKSLWEKMRKYGIADEEDNSGRLN